MSDDHPYSPASYGGMTYEIGSFSEYTNASHLNRFLVTMGVASRVAVRAGGAEVAVFVHPDNAKRALELKAAWKG